MTTKPTPDQARAYADALIAWSEGKKVEVRMPIAGTKWHSFDVEKFEIDFEYRVVPDPPKAREFWIDERTTRECIADGCEKSIAHSTPSADVDFLYARQILDTEIVVDKAEYEELRRNGAALKVAIAEWLSDNYHISLRDALAKHGAELR
jgi:hypothetical protein